MHARNVMETFWSFKPAADVIPSTIFIYLRLDKRAVEGRDQHRFKLLAKATNVGFLLMASFWADRP
jgi:hypothetical protein